MELSEIVDFSYPGNKFVDSYGRRLQRHRLRVR
jgi:hypothetical protein